MGRVRRAYYDAFAPWYDRFVALHSGDMQGEARRFLAERVPAGEGDSVLDLCTGTGTLLPLLRSKVGAAGRVAGADFSLGMLRAGRAKTKGFRNVHQVQADAASLPFRDDSFAAVTCSHAFYELKGETQDSALCEVLRVLRPGGAFLMMEHDVPRNLFVRLLFWVRLASMGTGRAFSVLRQERNLFERYFSRVAKIEAPERRSKVFLCCK